MLIRCQATTRPKDRWDSFHPPPCRKAAVVERGGKHYCKIHDPEYIEAKDKERNEKWNQKWAADRKRYDRNLLISRAFDGVTLEQIEARIKAGQCVCCGKPNP